MTVTTLPRTDDASSEAVDDGLAEVTLPAAPTVTPEAAATTPSPGQKRDAQDCADRAPDGCRVADCPNGWAGKWTGSDRDSPRKGQICLFFGWSQRAHAYQANRAARMAAQ